MPQDDWDILLWNGSDSASGRQSDDGARQSADGLRQSADGLRQSANGARQSADGARQSADGARQSADGARQSADGARQSADGGKKTSKKAEKKLPLWLVIARALYRFFTGLWAGVKKGAAAAWTWIKSKAQKAWAFLVDFFSGLPDGLRWLRRKRRNKRTINRIKRKRIRADRREQKAEQKEEAKAEKRREKQEKKEKQRKLREARRTPRPVLRFALLLILLCCILFYQLCIPVALGALCLYDNFPARTKNVTMVTTVGGVKEKVTLPAARAYPMKDGRLYLNMDVLAERFDIAQISDGTSIHYTLACGQKARLTAGSRAATLNGCAVTLPAPVVISGGVVWVPLELLTDYTDGLNVSFAKNTLTIVQEAEQKENELALTTYKEFRFTLSALQPAELPAEI